MPTMPTATCPLLLRLARHAHIIADHYGLRVRRHVGMQPHQTALVSNTGDALYCIDLVHPAHGVPAAVATLSFTTAELHSRRFPWLLHQRLRSAVALLLDTYHHEAQATPRLAA